MNLTDAHRCKVQRLASEAPPRVLDLFSGCGGLSLGFVRANFLIAGAVEFDVDAARSHGHNFHRDDARHAKSRDITITSPEQLAADLGLLETVSGSAALAEAVDVIVGGPPCQAFTRVGRSKLRDIREHPEAFLHDPRARLYLKYLEYVEAFQPLAILMENVPDVMNHGGQNIAEETAIELDRMHYEVRYTLLNAVHYGVPQMRERMFLLAVHKGLGVPVTFPKPTHRQHLPKGYASSRNVALRVVRSMLPTGKDSHYVLPPAVVGRKRAVSARDALSDLPPLTAHLKGESKRGVRRLDTLISHHHELPFTPYAERMRNWPGFTGPEGTHAHVIRHLPRDWEIFRRMQPGEQYPQAHKHALMVLQELLEAQEAEGFGGCLPGTRGFAVVEKRTVPPYDVSKFPNKWRKMEADQPARTLMAHLGKDSYSHIHYDSAQARTISVREAARLQSFPDGFVFFGSMNAAFRQIGNAVPPLMAYALAKSMRSTLRQGVRKVNELSDGSEKPAVPVELVST